MALKPTILGPLTISRGAFNQLPPHQDRTDGVVLEVCMDHPVLGRVKVTFAGDKRGLTYGVSVRNGRHNMATSTLSPAESEAFIAALGALLDEV